MAEPYVIKMPQLSDTMTEGVMVSWEKEVGEKINRGDVVATVETDKAIMDVEVFREGYLSGPAAPVGSVLPVGDPMAYLVATEAEVKHEEATTQTSSPAPKPAVQATQPSSTPSQRAVASPTPVAFASNQGAAPAPRPLNKNATPYARKLAGQFGIDLNSLPGTGTAGEIVADDVQRALAQRQSARPTTPQDLAAALPVVGQVRKMNALEKAISQSMTSSLSMPTFRVMKHAQPGALMKAAKQLGVSVTVAIAKACAMALKKHPAMNAAYVPDNQIAERDFVDIGMAVAVEGGGLVVPVLRHCDSLSLEELNANWKDLVKRARKRRLSPDEMSNPTFMVSNMGMMGVAYFDAIPTPGTTAILAISSTTDEGMPLTVTSDHRVVSGAEVASFLSTLQEMIETPSVWLGPIGPSIPEGDWDYQVVVIGGGPGGEDCARALSEHGIKVAMINDSPFPGGECLWRGCIPSKTWRAAADRIRDRQHDAHLGIEWSAPPTANWQALETSRRTILEERGGMALKTDTGMKIKYIQGYGSFVDDHHIRIDRSGNNNDPHHRPPQGNADDSEVISFGCAVIATGAPPFVPPVPGAKDGLANGGVLTSDSVWHLARRPGKIGIVGAGAIGSEMAQIFHDLGSKVVLVEMAEYILPGMDPELARGLQAVMERDANLQLCTSAKVKEVKGTPGNMQMVYEDREGTLQTFDCDYVLFATGKRPVVDGLQLGHAGVEVEKSAIKVDAFCRTNVQHIFGVGDVIGGLMLAHTAGHQGRIVASVIQGLDRRYDPDKDCGVIFTRPQAGFVGLTSDQAKEKGFQPVEAKFPMKIDAKAMITGETDGLIKLVADQQTERILGVHLLTDHTDTLIGEAVLMVSAGLTLAQVGEAIHPHPTQTELFGELARRLRSRIQRMKKRR